MRRVLASVVAACWLALISTATAWSTPPAGTVAAPPPTASNPARPRFALVSAPHQSCVDAIEDEAFVATLSMKSECSAASQQWISEQGRLMTAWMLAAGPKCIRRVSRQTNDLELVNCRATEFPAPDQMWMLRGLQVMGMDGRCLQTDGLVLTLGACDSQNAAQAWVAQPIR